MYEWEGYLLVAVLESERIYEYGVNGFFLCLITSKESRT